MLGESAPAITLCMLLHFRALETPAWRGSNQVKLFGIYSQMQRSAETVVHSGGRDGP